MIVHINVDVLSKEDCENYKRNNTPLSKGSRQSIESTIRKYSDHSKREIIEAIVIYAIDAPDQAVKFCREKGLFCFSNTENKYAEEYLEFLVAHQEFFDFSEETKHYIQTKNEAKWLREYFVSSEKEIIDAINIREESKEKFELLGNKFETSLLIELLTYLEIICRLSLSRVGITEKRENVNRNLWDYYGLEEKAEAISYLVYLTKQNTNIQKGICLWQNSEFVNSEEIEALVLMACKRNYLREKEAYIDYYGYDIETNQNTIRIFDSSEKFEQTLQVGFIKKAMQAQLLASHVKDSSEAESLSGIVEKITKEYKDDFFKLHDKGKRIERYVLAIAEPVIEYLMNLPYPSFQEEIICITDLCKEWMLQGKELLEMKLTTHCVVKDLMLLKRLFSFLAMLQNRFWDKAIEESKDVENTMVLMEHSIVPSFSEDDIYRILDPVFKHKKAKELITLLTWNETGVLDLQYTPIIKINQYHLVLGTFAISNTIRNTLVQEKRTNNQLVNSDRQGTVLEQKCEQIFTAHKDVFNYKHNVKFSFGESSGEIDFLAWTENTIYVFECKNPIDPTSPYELRPTFDYICKADKQLSLANKAFEDSSFRRTYFLSWGFSDDRQRDVKTCILLGNRAFTTYMYHGHAVRYIYELQNIMEAGTIVSPVGKWRYWVDDSFSEEDLKRYLSDADPLSKCVYESTEKYQEVLSCGERNISVDTYSWNMLSMLELQDKYLTIIEKDEEAWKDLLAIDEARGIPVNE